MAIEEELDAEVPQESLDERINALYDLMDNSSYDTMCFCCELLFSKPVCVLPCCNRLFHVECMLQHIAMKNKRNNQSVHCPGCNKLLPQDFDPRKHELKGIDEVGEIVNYAFRRKEDMKIQAEEYKELVQRSAEQKEELELKTSELEEEKKKTESQTAKMARLQEAINVIRAANRQREEAFRQSDSDVQKDADMKSLTSTTVPQNNSMSKMIEKFFRLGKKSPEDDIKPRQLGDYKILEELGSTPSGDGSLSLVVRVLKIGKNTHHVLKLRACSRITPSSNPEASPLNVTNIVPFIEPYLLVHLDHPNIIHGMKIVSCPPGSTYTNMFKSLVDKSSQLPQYSAADNFFHFASSNNFDVFGEELPLCGPDLDYAIHDGFVTELQVPDLACQLLSALAYMHRKYVVHRAICPAHILVSSPLGTDAKKSAQNFIFTGFGAAGSPVKVFTYINKGSSLCYYMPPNIFQSSETPLLSDSYSADVWALGIVLMQVLVGSLEPVFPLEFLGSELARELCERPVLDADIPKVNKAIKDFIDPESPFVNCITFEGVRNVKDLIQPVLDDDNILQSTKDRLLTTVGIIERMLTFNKEDRITAARALEIITGTEYKSSVKDAPSGVFPVLFNNLSQFVNEYFTFLLPESK